MCSIVTMLGVLGVVTSASASALPLALTLCTMETDEKIQSTGSKTQEREKGFVIRIEHTSEEGREMWKKWKDEDVEGEGYKKREERNEGKGRRVERGKE